MPVKDRDETLEDISTKMLNIVSAAERILPGIRFHYKYINRTKTVCGLLDNIDKLPAVKWKLNNLQKMTAAKHKKALEKLGAYLDISI